MAEITTKRERELMALCKERGIAVIRKGQAIRLSGPGVDMIVASLKTVSPDDLKAPFDNHRTP